MKTQLKSIIAIAALLALPLAQAAAMSKAERSTMKTQIGATYKDDKASCAALGANAKDICIKEAQGKERVALAELEANYTGKPADQNKVRVAKAEAAYAVSKEKCDDLAGNPKDVCAKEAKAVRVKALADAKVSRVVGAASTDAAKDKLNADYEVAAQKCDTMAGDAKAACVSAAKARFNKG